jgi:hypothetical protein
MDPPQIVGRDGRVGPPPPPKPEFRGSRLRRSGTTFGPVGRVVASVVLVAPLWWFWKVQTFAWPGLFIWGFVLVPWGMRDIWSRGRTLRR